MISLGNLSMEKNVEGIRSKSYDGEKRRGYP